MASSTASPNCLLNYRTRPRSSESRAFAQRAKRGADIHPVAVPPRTLSQPFSSPSCDTTPKIRKRTIAIDSYCQKAMLPLCSMPLGLKPVSFPRANFSSFER